MYLLLSGAKCNAGDFLIRERSVALLRALRPDRALHVLPSWQPLDPKAEEVRNARAIVLCGGPGLQPGFHPGVFPLLPRLEELPCPVVPLGLGWKGAGADDFAMAAYRFSEPSLAALRWIAAGAGAIGCRDGLSVEVLHRHGLSNTSMVGCPVWYDLPSIGRAPELDRAIDSIVFTPAQSPRLERQSAEVARAIAAVWPDAHRICSFHRGLSRSGPWIPVADIERSRRLAREVSALGFEVRDATGGTAGLRHYESCALHVGYRLHAHLDFLSRRRPSLLIEEDGRGAGASLSLGIAGIPAHRPRPWVHGAPRSLHRLAAPYAVRSDVASEVQRWLRRDRSEGFARYAGLGVILDRHFETMREFVARMP